MIKALKKIIYYVLTLLCIASCSEAVKPSPLTYTRVFTGDDHKSWSIQYLQVKQQGKGDQTFGLNTCEMDDQYIFYANPDRKYQVTNGASRCSNADPGVLADDSWSFVNATATLTIILPILSDRALPFFVRSVNEKQMVLEIFTDADNTSSYRIYFTPNKN